MSLAANGGVEPPPTASKAVVLPLHQSAMRQFCGLLPTALRYHQLATRNSAFHYPRLMEAI